MQQIKKKLFLVIQTNFGLFSILLKRGIQLNLRMSHPNICFPANHAGNGFDIKTYGSKTNTGIRSNCKVQILIRRLW